MVWLKYAKMVNDPETVYKHMLHNNIGTNRHELFYDWSMLLEKFRRNFEAASMVYQEGLKRVDES